MKAKIALLVFYLLVTNFVAAQVQHTATIEVVGSPSWYKFVSLGKEGMVLILKEDQTRFKIVKYGLNLQKKWEQNIFLDTEKTPAAIRLYKNRLAVMFAETSGMYYQILDFSLSDGEYLRRGFEVRDFFEDKDLIMFPEKAVLVGTNAKGLAYYVYDFVKETGKIIETDLKGTIEVEQVLLKDNNHLDLFAVEKTLGYSNEKKKKGEYVKNSQVIRVNLDTLGKIISKNKVIQDNGRFPMSGRWLPESNMVSGTYQDTNGQKGLYFSFVKQSENKPSFFIPFSDLVPQNLSAKGLNNFLKTARFYALKPTINPENIYVSGFFYNPDYNTTAPLGNPMKNTTPTKSTLEQSEGDLSLAFTFTLDYSGGLVSQNTIPMNQKTDNLGSSFVVNNSGAVAYLSKGKLLIRNFDVGSKPVMYQLTEDSGEGNPYVAAYKQVHHWYDNIFLVIGSQSKVEAQQLIKSKPETETKKKKRRALPFTQTRRTYFITSISAGQPQ